MIESSFTATCSPLLLEGSELIITSQQGEEGSAHNP